MDKCRICLIKKNTLLSIFECNNSTSYAKMVCSITNNVKIHRNDGITDKICRFCRKSLMDAYDLKILIEKSDQELNNKENIKKINFTDLQDIKIKVEIDLNDNKHCIPKLLDTNECLGGEDNEICYGDTTIKKIEVEIEEKPLPVLDFLKAIGEEPEDDEHNFNNDKHDYGPDIDDDMDYIPPFELLKKGKRKYKTRKKRKLKHEDSFSSCEDEEKFVKKNVVKRNRMKYNLPVQNVCIKPVLMKDLKPVLNLDNKKKEKKTWKDYYRTQRLEMCPHCGKMTKSLKTHILTHSGERKFKCEECGKGFFSDTHLRNHLKTHSTSKEFKCEHCVATFSSKSALVSHVITHTAEKKFVCGVCSKAFKRVCHNHQSRQHDACEKLLCHKISRNACVRHEMAHSLANKNIKCDQCNMSFFTKSGLRHHLRIHTGERPYKCELCNQPYSYKHDFNRHCLKKHGIFLKRRSVYVMNEEVMKQERALMKELLLKINGVVRDDKPLNPFDGPQGWLAFEYAVKALQNNVIPVDFTA